MSSSLPTDAYLKLALRGDTAACLALAQQALAEGCDVPTLYLELFQVTQYRVGELWAANQISMAVEHRATASTQAVIASLYERIPGLAPPATGRRMVMACVGQELHEVGARMVADLAELAGWDVVYLGRLATPAALVAAVREHDPDVLGLSATLVIHLDEVESHIRAVREALGPVRPYIMAGGRAFMLAPGAWRLVGADGEVVDARELPAFLARAS